MLKVTTTARSRPAPSAAPTQVKFPASSRRRLRLLRSEPQLGKNAVYAGRNAVPKARRYSGRDGAQLDTAPRRAALRPLQGSSMAGRNDWPEHRCRTHGGDPVGVDHVGPEHIHGFDAAWFIESRSTCWVPPAQVTGRIPCRKWWCELISVSGLAERPFTRTATHGLKPAVRQCHSARLTCRSSRMESRGVAGRASRGIAEMAGSRWFCLNRKRRRAWRSSWIRLWCCLLS